MPVIVAVVYAEGLRNHKCIVSSGYIAASWSVETGKASIEMFDRMLGALFDKVIRLDSHLEYQTYAGRYPLIEVGLLRYDGCEAAWPIVGSTIEIGYEATLRDKDGILIARWQGSGRTGSGDDLGVYQLQLPVLEVETRYLGGATSVAMRKAAADFIINFEKERPGIAARLRR